MVDKSLVDESNLFSHYCCSDRTEYRDGRAYEQIFRGFEDTQNSTLDIVKEVCRGYDRVQSDANRLQRTV